MVTTVLMKHLLDSLQKFLLKQSMQTSFVLASKEHSKYLERPGLKYVTSCTKNKKNVYELVACFNQYL